MGEAACGDVAGAEAPEVTPELLVRAVSHLAPARAEVWAPVLTSAWVEWGITDIEIPMWLAQCGHESGSFRQLVEMWGPTAQQLRYERSFVDPWPSNDDDAKQARFFRNKLAYRIGNTEPGDGSKFRGHGLIQITGRTNHERCGKALGLDLVASPAQIAVEPLQAARSACWFWVEHGLGRHAMDVKAATLAINGGLNGYDDRKERYQRALAALSGSVQNPPK